MINVFVKIIEDWDIYKNIWTWVTQLGGGTVLDKYGTSGHHTMNIKWT